jgi:hypothetical protein
MADTASQTSQEGLGGKATSQVQEAASSAQEKAVELKEQGKGKLGDVVEQRTSQAGGQAHTMARALRRSAEQMRSEDNGRQVAGLASGASERIDRLGSYLEQTSGDELLRDVEDFARRRPWAIAAVGLLAGLAASRFLKASSERRYGETSGDRYGGGRSTGRQLATEPLATAG